VDRLTFNAHIIQTGDVVPAQHHPQDEEPYQPVDAANIGERQTNNTLGGADQNSTVGNGLVILTAARS
jgi:hypothetical protein